jgi:hypothetical protein
MFHKSVYSTDAYLRGDGMTPGGKKFSYACGVQTSFGKAEGSTKTSTTRTTRTRLNVG